MGAVEFRLLGDVEVRVDGRVVDVGHARQRCVLALLLLDANQVVPVDQLLDRTWGDRLPQRARAALGSYVSRLRKALAGIDGVEIRRQANGYVLRVDPLAVDVHRFRQSVRDARAAGDPERAAALYEQALRLWRGEAFASLDCAWLGTVRDSMRTERLGAMLDRNSLALDAGQHADLLAELSAWVATNPLDERLTGQLMLALYRCGRQADALLHYEGIRARLAEELGVDPSPELRQMHQQILTADPVLTHHSPSRPDHRTGGTGGQAPRQLPAPPRAFVARTGELATLNKLLDIPIDHPSAMVITVVSGTAGVGKTALAVHWAHQVADRFPDGHLYVNLRGFGPDESITEPAEAIRGFLDALNVPPQRIPSGLDARAGLYRSLLADKRMLIVLDNARNAEHVRPLLPGALGCLTLVTSRDRLTGLIIAEGAHPITLDVLPTAEARELLARRLGAERVAAEPDAVHAIITACTRLPLALAIAAARAQQSGFRLTALAAELNAEGGRLDALDAGDATSQVRAVFSWSYTALTAPAARLFRLLGIPSGPDISTAAAANLTGHSPPEVRRLLGELVRANLLTEHSPGRYTFHDLLRAYAAEQARAEESDGERRIALRRLLDHYVHTAHTADRLLHPHRDPIPLPLAPPSPGTRPEHLADDRQATAWLATERPVLLAVLQQAADTGLDTHTWQLAWVIDTFLHRRGHRHDWVAAWQAAEFAANRIGDPAAQAYAHRVLGYANIEAGAHADGHTHLRRALDLYAEAGDPVGQANVHRNLAYLGEQAGEPGRALDHSRRALTLFQAIGDVRGQALALNAVGWYHALLGEYAETLTHCGRALALLRELGERHGQAASWDSLGYAHHHLGHHSQAADCYRHSIALLRDMGDRYYEAAVLDHLGDTHHAAGDPTAAHRAWHQAAKILDQLDHPDADQVRAKLTNAAGRVRPAM